MNSPRYVRYRAEVPADSREALERIASLGPTRNPLERSAKGYVHRDDPEEDGRAYYDPEDLRVLGRACIELADWLDKTAEEAKEDPTT